MYLCLFLVTKIRYYNYYNIKVKYYYYFACVSVHIVATSGRVVGEPASPRVLAYISTINVTLGPSQTRWQCASENKKCLSYVFRTFMHGLFYNMFCISSDIVLKFKVQS